MARPEFFGVPEEVWENLEYEVARNDLEYSDNFRAYRVRDNFLRREFKRAQRRGCCGEFETYTKVDGDTWKIGCNYGH